MCGRCADARREHAPHDGVYMFVYTYMCMYIYIYIYMYRERETMSLYYIISYRPVGRRRLCARTQRDVSRSYDVRSATWRRCTARCTQRDVSRRLMLNERAHAARRFAMLQNASHKLGRFRRMQQGGTAQNLEGAKGVPRNGGGVVSNSWFDHVYSQFVTCSSPHIDRCSNPLPWDLLSSP